MSNKNINNGTIQYKKYVELMSLIKMLAMISAGLLLVLLVLMFRPDHRYFYAAANKGQTTMRLNASNQPTLTQDFVIRWAKVAVRQAYNFNFNNHATVLKNIRHDFTPAGYSSFMDAIDNSSLVSDIDSKQLMMTAIVPSTPVITYKGKVNNKFTWVMRMPLLLNFESASVPSYQERKIVNLTVARVASSEAPYSGIEISRFITNGTI